MSRQPEQGTKTPVCVSLSFFSLSLAFFLSFPVTLCLCLTVYIKFFEVGHQGKLTTVVKAGESMGTCCCKLKGVRLGCNTNTTTACRILHAKSFREIVKRTPGSRTGTVGWGRVSRDSRWMNERETNMTVGFIFHLPLLGNSQYHIAIPSFHE